MTVMPPKAAPEHSALPRDLAGFKDRHAGGAMVVCGCGASLRDLDRPERFTTIGVNDVGRLFTPDYLLVVNTRHQFGGERFQAVEQSRARVLFTSLDLGVPHPHVVRFGLGRRGGTGFGGADTLDYTRNSPYPALCLALHMGARRIGLIGVDFTDGHFFGGTAPHALARELPQIDAEYRRLGEACAKRGIEIVNLSAASRLTAFPKMSVEAFAARGRPARALRIVSYATTPVAGVPAVLGRAIAHETAHEGRTVWASNGYGNGVVFDGDVEYQRRPAEAAELLDAADVVVVHNGKVDGRHAALIDRKPVVTMAHNYMWNVDPRFVDRGYPGLVVGQYQATLAEFAGWAPVPNPIPLWEPSHAPGDAADKDGPVTICYLPSGKHESFPVGHRLYWHAKGYRSTMAVLEALRSSHGIRLDVARDRQVSHRESMAMKRRAHIVIDECVTGSYHRTSLEGLAVGAVVVNGIGRLPGVPDVLRLCAEGTGTMPFVAAGPDTLHDVLLGLIALGPEALTTEGRRGRLWMERHWTFARQWPLFWMPAVERAMAVAGDRRPAPGRRPPPPPSAPAPEPVPPPPLPALAPVPAILPRTPTGWPPTAREVTAVVPVGGADRLPALNAVLTALGHQGLGGVIVVESAREPLGRDIALAAGARYIFAPSDVGFHKARAMNVGAGAVTTDILLWCDADLVLPKGFVEDAVAELDLRRLDYLVPWTSVRYLDAADSHAVMAGTGDGSRATPLRTVFSRHGDRGGLGLLRTAFLRRHGGLCEDFRGWGGEDEAFFHKASLFARAAVTNRNDRPVDHLFHPLAGGLDPVAAMAANPHHPANRALCREIRAIGSRERFLRRFPAPTHPAAPWPGVMRLACAPGTEELGRALAAHYGPAIVLCGPDDAPDATLPALPDAEAGPSIRRDEVMECAARLTLPPPPASTAAGPATPHRTGPPASHGSSIPPMRLNLGCGDASVAGFVNVDRFPTPNVDETVDLAAPWPWPDGSVEAIRAWDVIEHLPDKIRTMNEMWRVLRPGGQAEIVVPTTDGPGAFQDPTHVSFWHRRSFLYYEAGNPYRERFAASYGIRAAFRVLREQTVRTADGPKLTIVLEAVKP